MLSRPSSRTHSCMFMYVRQNFPEASPTVLQTCHSVAEAHENFDLHEIFVEASVNKKCRRNNKEHSLMHPGIFAHSSAKFRRHLVDNFSIIFSQKLCRQIAEMWARHRRFSGKSSQLSRRSVSEVSHFRPHVHLSNWAGDKSWPELTSPHSLLTVPSHSGH